MQAWEVNGSSLKVDEYWNKIWNLKQWERVSHSTFNYLEIGTIGRKCSREFSKKYKNYCISGKRTIQQKIPGAKSKISSVKISKNSRIRSCY